MNVMELSARLSLDAKNFDKGIKSAESGFKSFGSRLSSIGGKIVKGLSVATAAAAAGFVALGKNAVGAYAQYEQLVGGVETLFKDSAGQLQKYADVSYKTAGVSANRFMEMSTSFAAALVQGLGGDTARAADMANTAIIDMSDNANKMGTDMTMLQNAYQGFAKQNFTMLDNLKIGYGGTKTEMERLLSDAEKLTGKKYDVSNFADIVDAIHAIQTQMGITGTTAKEAENTISGSMNMVKAAWEDLLVAMSKPQEVTGFFGNIQDEANATAKTIENGPKEATRRFAQSVKTMLGNVLPAVRNFLNGFGEVVAEIAPIIGEELPQLLADFAPKLLEAGKNLVVGLGKGITKAFQKFKWPTWKDVQSGAQKAWQGIQKGVEWLGGLVFGTDPKTGGVKWPTWATVKEAAQKAWNAIREKALHMVGALAFGTDEKGQVNWPDWDEDTTGLEKVWDTVKAVAAKAGETFGALVFGRDEDTGEVKWPTWDGVTTGAKDLWEKAKAVAADAVNQFGAFVFGKDGDTGEVKWPDWDGVTTGAVVLWNKVKQYASNIVSELGGLVFGKDEDTGSVKWPTLNDVDTGIKEIWDIVKEKALDAGKLFGALVFGRDTDTGEINWPDANKLGGAVNTWWKDNVVPLLNLAFGITEPGSEEATAAQTIINDWWDTFVKPGLKLVADFSLGVLGFENFEQLTTQVYNWFQDKFGWLYDVLGVDKNPKEHNYLTDEYRYDRSGYEGTLRDKAGAVSGAGSQYVINTISKIDKLLSGGTASDFEKFAKEMIALSDTEAGKGMFSEETLSALNMIREVGEATPNEMKTLAEMIQGDLMNSITQVGNGFEGANSKVNSFADALVRLPNKIDIKVNLIPGNRLVGYSGMFDTSGQFKIPGFNAKGSWNVPYDNMPALLHRNEMVLTATQARQYREGRGGSLDAATLANAMRSAVLDLTMELNGEAVGRVFGDQTTRRVNHNISQINRRHRYGYGG